MKRRASTQQELITVMSDDRSSYADCTPNEWHLDNSGDSTWAYLADHTVCHMDKYFTSQ